MKNNSRFKTALKGFTATITRYPAAILLFFISAAVASYNIDTNEIDNLPEILFSLALGAAVSWCCRWFMSAAAAEIQSGLFLSLFQL